MNNLFLNVKNINFLYFHSIACLLVSFDKSKINLKKFMMSILEKILFITFILEIFNI